MQPPPPPPTDNRRGSGSSRDERLPPPPTTTRTKQVSIISGKSESDIVICRFRNSRGQRKTMMVVCACGDEGEDECDAYVFGEEKNKYIHRACLDIQRWTDPNPSAFKMCTACGTDYMIKIREGADVDSGSKARVLRVLCSDSFFLIMALLTGVAICTGIVERFDSCFSAPGGCGEHCKGCCNVPTYLNKSANCPKGGDLLNKFGLKDEDSDGGVQYKTTYFMLGSIVFLIFMGILGTLDLCCVTNHDKVPVDDNNNRYKAGGLKEGDGETKFRFLIYVYCCM